MCSLCLTDRGLLSHLADSQRFALFKMHFIIATDISHFAVHTWQFTPGKR